MRGFLKKSWIFFSMLLFLAACNSETAGELNNDGEDKIKVLTTIAQIGEPLSVIGGERVKVESLMGPSVDPHLYSPTQSDIKKVSEAEIIFYNGLNLEANMVEVFNSIGMEKPVLAVGETIDENDLLYDEGGAIDPHIWFELNLWQQALDAAVEELKAYAPEYADYFDENKEAYFAELDSLKEDAKKLLDIPESQRILVTAHDAFGYFGRMHEMQVVGLQGLSTEDEVGLTDINKTIKIIEEHKVPAIFVETSISSKTIEAVIDGANNKGIDVSLGGELYSDALGAPGSEEGTYLGMYRYNINTIYEALNRKGE